MEQTPPAAPAEASASPPFARDRFLQALLVLALAARLVSALGPDLLNADGESYLDSARLLREGRWHEAMVFWQPHPLYPFLIAAVEWLIPSPWAAGASLSVAAGVVATLLLYRIAFEGWGRNSARAAGFLYALHPGCVRMESGVLTEGVYHALAFAAVFCIWRSLRRKSLGWGVGGGALIGLAYLARMEGLLLACATLGAAGLACLKERSLRETWRPLLLAALTALIVASPFLIYIRVHFGNWRPSSRPATNLISVPFERPSGKAQADMWERLGRGPGTVANLSIAAARTFSPVPLALLAVAIVLFRRGLRGDGMGLYLAGSSLGLLAAVGLFQYKTAYVITPRYVSTAAALLLPFAAHGLSTSLAALSALPRGRLWAGAILLIAAVPLLIKVPNRDGPEGPLLREAAAWLRENGAVGRRLVAERACVAYHAGAQLGVLCLWEQIPELARRGELDFIVVYEPAIASYPPSLWTAIESARGVSLLRHFGPADKGVRVYAVRPPS